MHRLARPEPTQRPDPRRRSALLAGLLSAAGSTRWLAGGAVGLGLWPTLARAGGQVEEPLADAVRSALSAAVADSAPPRLEFPQIEQRLAYLRWLGNTGQRLMKRKPDFDVRREFLETLWYESRRAGLDPSLVLGVVEVESGFRKYAISSAGARGYMQVMPFWARLIGDGDASRLFHLQTNLRFGCVILRHYLDRERGDLFMALGRYNGSRGQAPYPTMVLGARKRWMHPDDGLRTAGTAAVDPADAAR